VEDEVKEMEGGGDDRVKERTRGDGRHGHGGGRGEGGEGGIGSGR